jgi:phosphoenolpyruvate carboxykinase (GTP)
MLDRVAGRAAARDTPIGYMPAREDLKLEGLGLSESATDALLDVDAPAWRSEFAHLSADFEQYGERLPAALREQLNESLRRLA